ncbi:hypothetical protein M5K25_017981 [Dendrobium thyrsiflorum]|uniref:Uncharacterized protein n=1 Tax=Dendrobium thyrsiflorum TaxID=117978 RepID=A0ABD0UHA3_DENTH
MKTKKPLTQLKVVVSSQEKPVTDFLFNYEFRQFIPIALFAMLNEVFLAVACHFRTASGTFQDGDLLLNKKGLRLISEESSSQVGMELLLLLRKCLEGKD